MRNGLVVAALALLAGGCATTDASRRAGDDPARGAQGTAAANAASDESAPNSATAVAAAVASAERLEADLARDAARRPAEVLSFFGIAPGMRVLDLYSGGGYYTELLARTVGPSGRVVAHNNQAYVNFTADEIATRYVDGRLPNVERLMAENNELTLPRGSLDAVVMMLVYHDVYYIDEQNGWPQLDGPALLAELFDGLKPGGTLGVVDHIAQAGADPWLAAANLHRIDPIVLREDLEAAGFVFDGASQVLRRPDDTLEKMVFEETMRGRTDRVVWRFRRP